jgi:hypothetical protein
MTYRSLGVAAIAERTENLFSGGPVVSGAMNGIGRTDYASVVTRARRVASALKGVGVGPGDPSRHPRVEQPPPPLRARLWIHSVPADRLAAISPRSLATGETTMTSTDNQFVARCRIAGEWRDGQGDQNAQNSPYDGKPASVTRAALVAEADEAIAAAWAARQTWATTPALARAAALHKAAGLVASRTEEPARLISREMGRVYSEAVEDVEYAAHDLNMTAEYALPNCGQVVPGTSSATEDTKRVLVLNVPVGAVGIATPRNFPMAIPREVLGPGLASGLVVAAEEGGVCSPRGKRGLVAAGCGLLRLPRRVPQPLAMELALLGDDLTTHATNPKETDEEHNDGCAPDSGDDPAAWSAVAYRTPGADRDRQRRSPAGELWRDGSARCAARQWAGSAWRHRRSACGHVHVE